MKRLLTLIAASTLSANGALAQTKELTIGVLNDQSSLYSDLTGSGSITAARMAIDDFKQLLPDYKINLVSADHQNKPDIGSSIARRWITADGVDVIVDVPTSSVAFAIQEMTRGAKIPFLISGAASSDLTGKACSPTSVHWTYDTYALAAGAARGVVRTGRKKWFFIAQDNAFGSALQRDISKFVIEAGGSIVGSIKHPLNESEFSSYILQAEAAKPDVVALANAGSDFTNALKQAAEFGLTAHDIKIVGTSVTINDVHGLGLNAAKGVQFAVPFYWDMTDKTREWSKRFFEVEKKMPNHIHAGVYGSVQHYLQAVAASGTTEGPAVVKKMKETPINDFFTKEGRIRKDGKVLREYYLMEVKAPEESKQPWDYLKVLETISAEETAVPEKESECSLIKK
jgi:branched-chain amino acid transport system substrate-binding protein